jgi:CheY-like chemotaxis protein
VFSDISLKGAGEISVYSKVAEGSTFAFFIPADLSTLSLHHEVTPQALQIHHSLKNQALAPSGDVLAITTHVDATTSESSSHDASSSQADTGIVSVLLVEDNEILQKLLKKQLVRAGYSVMTANDGVEAVEYMSKSACQGDAGCTEMAGSKNARVDLILMGEYL